MNTLDAIVLERLEKRGVAPSEAMRLVKDVAVAISSGQPADPEVISRHLQTMGWHRLELDARTLELIVQGFGAAGRLPLTDDDHLKDPAGLQQLVDKIFRERGIDFRGYSQASLSRRIARRLRVCNISCYADYRSLLDKDPREYERLINSIFVTVTRFFRNEAAFEALTQVLEMVMGKLDGRSVNIWSAGCATGQEPYTIAMLAAEKMAAASHPEVRITATDIDDHALEEAGRARFSGQEIRDVPDQWRQRYFEKHADGYRMAQAVRDLVDFRHHNLVSDSPLEGMDIITCRNVLIYFNLALQMRVIDKLFNSLRAGGHLLLGRYEMLIKQARRQFVCVDFDARLYRKRS